MNRMDHTVRCLSRLTELPDFKMYFKKDKEYSDLVVEADGITFYMGHLSLEEGIESALIHISARIQARELVKQAKIVLEIK